MKSDNETPDNNYLQKMYSAHVQENLVLHRHKTDLDHAKLKKLRQLNFDEEVFLRKYEKYTEPGAARSMRSSIDASILKVSEVNSTDNQQSENNAPNKSLGRSAINNDCPYSLDSWNNMVDAEKNILDAYKTNILFGDNKHQDRPENKSLFGKKQTLKPINIQSPTIEFTGDGFDEEIQMAQGGFRKRSNTADSIENGISLSKLRNRRSSTDMAAIRLPSIKYSQKYSPRIRKKKTSSSSSPRESSDDESGNRSDKDTCLSKSADSNKGILRKSLSPKPVANASVFVHQDQKPITPSTKSRRSSFDISSLMADENAYLENLRRRTRSPSVSFLPIIPQSPILVNRQNSAHHTVSESGSIKDMKDTHQTDLRRASNATSPRIARRSSTSTLKLMVDTHYGAAKLRYIERLAVEMEKEETAKLQPEERPVSPKKEEPTRKPFEELRNCRYLRMTSKNDTPESEAGNGVLST